MDPDNALQMLVDACGPCNKITVEPGAENDAARDFNLLTKEQIYYFIANGELGKTEFIGRSIYRKKKKVGIEMPVYEYRFYSHELFGYLAFAVMPSTNFIVIKSFKENREEDPRNLPFQGLQDLLAQLKKGD